MFSFQWVVSPPSCFSPYLYRARNAIERMFCRLEDFPRIATRSDRSAAKFPRRLMHRRDHQLLVMSRDPGSDSTGPFCADPIALDSAKIAAAPVAAEAGNARLPRPKIRPS
jgi:hypothetical protein